MSISTGLPIAAALVILVALFTIGAILARLYKRSSKEIAYVRTGFGGQRVIMDGGSLVFPILHEVIAINMNTLRLEVQRAAEGALITKDRMRVDVGVEFYLRVKPTAEAIADAAQTLGHRTLDTVRLSELVEGKFVDALRAVAAEMRMDELHEKRVDFVQKVQVAVSEDLLKNGLELESVSLTSLDQTNREFFNPDNAFDAEGLTRLTEEIEARRRKRNEIEQDTEVAVAQKNVAAEREKLAVMRDKEFAVLEHHREVEVRRAEHAAQIAREQAARKREAEEAQIAAQQAVEEARQRAAKEESLYRAEADRARALAVDAEEAVATVRETAAADRCKRIELIEARKRAERDAIGITVAAEAEKNAADDRAEAVKTLAEAKAAEQRISASGEAEAEKLRADAAQLRYAVEAEGKRALNAAENLLSHEVIAMRVKLALIQNLDRIVAESVKPLQQIEGIKIIQVDGLGSYGAHAGAGNGAAAPGDNLADHAVAAALRYRSQAPLIDALIEEIGLDGASLAGLTRAVGPATIARASADEPAR